LSSTVNQELVEEANRLLPTVTRLLKATMVVPCDITNVPYGQIRVLSHLYQHGHCTVSEVAAGLGVSLATASELADRQVETGWIERSHNPADRRQVILTLSPDATEIFSQIDATRRKQISEALARLEAEDRPAFVRGLRALVQSLEESVKQAELSLVQ
jgi:DNA-binding MarR family transcriptional regulator